MSIPAMVKHKVDNLVWHRVDAVVEESCGGLNSHIMDKVWNEVGEVVDGPRTPWRTP